MEEESLREQREKHERSAASRLEALAIAKEEADRSLAEAKDRIREEREQLDQLGHAAQAEKRARLQLKAPLALTMRGGEEEEVEQGERAATPPPDDVEDMDAALFGGSDDED